MSLDSEILRDFHQLLAEHGTSATWKDIPLHVLVSRVRSDQQIEIGGFVESPELNLRVLKLSFLGELPKFGERIELDGRDYRIAKVGFHPRSPIITLSLTSTDE
jgi:hypothetical protein